MKHCYFCTNNIKKINYKDIESLKKFIDPQAKIVSRKQNHLCVKHQRKLSQSIKRARFLAFIPFVEE